MAFNAGAVIGRVILDSSRWVKGIKTVKGSSKGLIKGFKKIGGVALRLGAGIAAALVPAIAKASQFNKEFANVTTLLDTSRVNIDNMKKDLLALDSRLGSSLDLTKGLYQALSASVAPSKAVKFVGEAAKFAKAALTDTNTAVDVITTGLNAYGFAADKATVISDQLFSVIKLGKTTGAELAGVIGQSIPLAANMGVSFDQLGASIAIMTRQGVKASEATTQFNSVLISLIKPSDTMKAALSKLGFESGQAAIKAKGFKGILDTLVGSVEGNKEQLGEMFNNTRALRGIMALTGEGAKDFDDVLGQIKDSAGATTEAFNKQDLTFDTLRNNLEKATIQIGTALLPSLMEFTDGINTFFEENKAEITAILGNLPAIFSKTFELIKKIIEKAFSTEGFKETITVLAKSFFKAFQIAIGAIPGLFIGTLKLLFVPIKNFAGFVAQSFEKIFGDVTNFFIDTLNVIPFVEIKKAAAKEVKSMEAIWDDTLTEMADEAGGLLKTVTDALDKIAVVSKESGAGLGEVFKEEIGEFTAFIDGLVQESRAAINSASSAAVTGGNRIDATTEKIKAATGAVKGFNSEASKTITLSDVLSKSVETLGKTTSSVFTQVGNDIATGIKDGVDGFTILADAGKNAIATFVDALGQQWAVQAAAALIPGPTFNPVAAAGLGALSIGAAVTAGLIRGLAGGGVGQAGEVALVGEQGPELVRFGSASRVFPNEETRGMMGGVSMVVNFNGPINSEIDIQRAMQQAGNQLRNKIRTV